MAINKNFVVKNGLEVNTELILANAITNKVGIGTSLPYYELHVNGGIGCSDLYVSGVTTSTSYYGEGSTLTFSLSPISVPGINVTGVSTLATVTATDLTAERFNVSGIATIVNAEITSLTGTAGTITDFDSTNGSITNLTGTAATITTLDTTDFTAVNGSITNLTGTAATIGTVQIASGIITSSSGVVTYYGDGSNLNGLPVQGLGIRTEAGTVGTGVTILDFRGAGISTVTVTAGIGTLHITGGGGGSISISTSAPPGPSNGDLWYSPDYGRTFIYYDESSVGYGTSKQWVDAAPFNVGILSATRLVVADLDVTNSATIAGILTIGTLNVTDVSATGVVTATSGVFDSTTVGSAVTSNSTGIIVVGIVTASGGFVGDLTGTADNATNITLADESSDTTCFPLFATDATGNQAPKTDSSALTYNASTGTLSATFSGNLTGNVTGNADTATTATNATNITLADESSDTTCFPLFATDATGNQAPKTDSSSLTYNASTGQLTAVDLNATSDINLKKDIEVITDATDLIKQLNGVRFTWKVNDRKSLGVIAQEVEELFPELISERTDTGTKSVNYNGLVGVLIEAVKELSARVDELERM